MLAVFCLAGLKNSHRSLIRLLKQLLYSPRPGSWSILSPALQIKLYQSPLSAATAADPLKSRCRMATWRFISAVCYRAKAAAYKELAERTARHEKLQLLALHMSRQKELMVGFYAFGSTLRQR